MEEEEVEEETVHIAPDAHRLYLASRGIGSVPDNMSFCQLELGGRAIDAWGSFRDSTATGDFYSVCAWLPGNASPTGAVLTSPTGRSHAVELAASSQAATAYWVQGRALIARDSQQAQFVGMAATPTETPDFNQTLVQIFIHLPLSSPPGTWRFEIVGDTGEVNGTIEVDGYCGDGTGSANPFFWVPDLRNHGNYTALPDENPPVHEENCRVLPNLEGMSLNQIQNEVFPYVESLFGVPASITGGGQWCNWENLVDYRVVEHRPGLFESEDEMVYMNPHAIDSERCRTRIPRFENSLMSWIETPGVTGNAAGSASTDGNRITWEWQLGADADGTRRALSSLVILENPCWDVAEDGVPATISFEMTRSITDFAPAGTSPQVSERFAVLQGDRRHLPEAFNDPITAAGATTARLTLGPEDFDSPLDVSEGAPPICFGVFRSVSTTGTGEISISHEAADFSVVVEPALLPYG